MRTSATTFLALGLVLVTAGCSKQEADAGLTSATATVGGSGNSGGGANASLGGSGIASLGGSGILASLGGSGILASLGGSGIASLGGSGIDLVNSGGSGITTLGGSATTTLGGSGGTTDPTAGGTTATTCRTCGPNNCGQMDDLCGAVIDCGTCASGTCGKTSANICDTCTPVTCAGLGKNCGFISDGCGLAVDCGACTGTFLCGVVEPNVCGDPVGTTTTCTNFCLDQVNPCPAGSTTSTTTVKGTVWAPSGNPPINTARGEGSLPMPNALVYVPNGSKTSPYGLSVFVDGVAASACACDVQGSPLVNATTNVDGSFTLENVPVGANIPLVIQLGRWRRVITIPNVASCTTTTLSAEQTRLPRRQAEGHEMDAIPKMAVSTGDVDALECVLRKMGVEDSQFSNPNGTGRIWFYQDNGGVCTTGGGACTGNTPPYAQLTANQATIDQYDALLFPCRASAHDKAVADKQRVINAQDSFVNKGGRAFFTHFSYAWLYRNDAQPPTSTNLPWPSKTVTAQVNTQWTTEFGAVDTSFPRGLMFRDWLALPIVNGLTASTPVSYITIDNVRRDVGNPANWDTAFGVNATPVPLAERWLYSYQSTQRAPNDAIFHLSYDAPWGAPLEERCGRVLYSSFHVTGANTQDELFPSYCTNVFTAQEKILAYMMFDMTSCVQPPVLTCVPKTCAEQVPPIDCGLAGDGCGGLLDCGPCCPTPLECGVNTPRTSQPHDPANPGADCIFDDGCNPPLVCTCIG